MALLLAPVCWRPHYSVGADGGAGAGRSAGVRRDNPVDDLTAVGPPLSAEETATLEARSASIRPNLSGNAAGKVRIPRLPQPAGFDVKGADRPDSFGTVTVKQPLSTEWNANVGADFESRRATTRPLSADEGAAGASL